MAKKKLSTVKPNLPKEYVWTLLIDEVEREYKCLVTETDVTTYEDGVQKDHIRIEDTTCLEGTLQIDTKTEIFGDTVEFQLERFIPYIRLEDRWVMSDTTENDRLNEQIGIYKKQSKQETVIGVAAIAFTLGMYLFTGNMDDWWILIIFGIFFLSSAAMRMVRLRNELNALKELKEQEEAEKAAGNEYLTAGNQTEE